MDQSLYASKGEGYFTGERRDFIDPLPARGLRILELGCGDGANAAYARQSGKVAFYAGVELFEDAARIAEPHMDALHVGDVEKLDITTLGRDFDVVIMSEVLEHLVDPWAVLRGVREVVTPDAVILASSPCVCHYSTVLMLLRGRWDLTDSGRMDRTHLRWFTPTSYARMFEDCGFRVGAVERMNGLTRKHRLAMRVLPARYHHLFTGQMRLRARVG